MTTIPHLLNGELINLVPIAELEKTKLAAIGLEAENAGLRADNAELLERLEERTQSHLHASARDVQTIQRQAVEISKWQALAETLVTTIKEAVSVGCEYYDMDCGGPNGAEVIAASESAIAAYESAKKGELL